MNRGSGLNWRGWVCSTLGVVLLAAAVWYALQGVRWGVVAAAPWWMGVGLAVLVGVNLLLTSTLFWLVTRGVKSDRPVRWWPMTLLIAASALLNYVPVARAGLWGRAAYLKQVHGVSVRDSLRTLLVVLGLAAAVLGGVGLVLVGVAGSGRWWACGVVLLVLTVISAAAGPRLLGAAGSGATTAAWAWVPLRTLDLAAAAGRLWIGFAVVGQPVGFGEAVVMASASLLVKLAGLTPNGLGLSEWAVASVSAVVSPAAASTAAAAALVDRAVEVVVAVVTGLAAIGWLTKRRRVEASRDADAASGRARG